MVSAWLLMLAVLMAATSAAVSPAGMLNTAGASRRSRASTARRTERRGGRMAGSEQRRRGRRMVNRFGPAGEVRGPVRRWYQPRRGGHPGEPEHTDVRIDSENVRNVRNVRNVQNRHKRRNGGNGGGDNHPGRPSCPIRSPVFDSFADAHPHGERNESAAENPAFPASCPG